jgi:hypothetical protein
MNAALSLPIRRLLLPLWILGAVLFSPFALAQAQAQDPTPTPPPPNDSLDNRIQDLKQEVLKLNRDLFILEEDLLFPASTQLVVFLSMDVGLLFDLDSVELKLNDKTIANYLYTTREQDALKRGGVQQLWIGNVATGKNEIVAFFYGKGPHNRDYQRGSTFVVDKALSPKYVELKISDNAQKQQPEFVIREW